MLVKDFKKLLAQVLMLVTKNPVVPILTTIKFSNNSMMSSNLVTFIKVDFKHDIEACLEGAILKRLVSSLDNEDTISFAKGKEGKIDLLVNGVAEFSILADSIADFPSSGDESSMIPVGNFSEEDIEELSKMAKFASRDELRPAMQAVCIEKNMAVATDSHTLIMTPLRSELNMPLILVERTEQEVLEQKLQVKTAEAPNILVRQEAIAILQKMKFKGVFGVQKHPSQRIQTLVGPMARLFQPGKFAYFVGDGFTLMSRTVDERYPDYKKVVPEFSKHSHYEVIFDVKELEKTVKKALVAANQVTKRIVLDWSKAAENKLVVSAEDLDFGSEFAKEITAFTTETVKLSDKNSMFTPFTKIGFNGKFLLDILSTYGEKHTTLRTGRPGGPAVWDERFLLMPINISETAYC